MIRIKRLPLDEALEKNLVRQSSLLAKRNANPESARRSWKNSARAKMGIRNALFHVASGVERCMYCGDSRGTDIDHFQPIAVAPLRTFDWKNHLLACSTCNSNEKRDAYPCDQAGQSLLIDPSIEDPADHIKLELSEGVYAALTHKGCASITVFGLNRADLRKGRSDAFIRCKSMLRDYRNSKIQGKIEDAENIKDALQRQPFADVLNAMYRVADLPGAAVVFEDEEIVAILKNWRADSMALDTADSARRSGEG
jgi:hypothetical protein